jgi:enediyne biosynthesis protein E4
MMRGVLIATISFLVLPGPAMAAGVKAMPEGVVIPAFVEETVTSGIATSFDGEWQYMVGGGAASFDCSGDGYPDLLLAGGASKAGFYVNTSSRGGALTFEKRESGLELDAVLGTHPFDADADGVTDVMLLRFGENVLMRGRGDCLFERANETWGYPGGDEWSTAFSVTWERGADWPTMAVGNYIDRHEEFSPWGSCTPNWLHRPQQGEKRFAPPVALTPAHCPLSILFTDWDRSGTPALRVSNDREYYEGGQEQMWRMPANAAPSLYTEADGWKRLRIWGMGIGSTDIDGDTRPDYYLTSMADAKLQVLDPQADGAPLKPSFGDIAYKRGVTAHRPHTGDDLRPSTSWHAQFDDVNNDGRVDLFVAKGNVDAMPDFAAEDPNNLFVQGKDGVFTDMSVEAGVASKATSRGAVMADFNLDGLLDLVVVNRRATAQIWRNVTQRAGNWLHVRPQMNGANRDAINGWLEVRRGDVITRRELFNGGGQASGQHGWWHMGLGDATEAEVRVLWPHAEEGPWQTVAANGFYALKMGAEPEAWAPAR